MNDLLVTGATGLLGSAIRALCPAATFVSSRTADLRDAREVAALFNRVRPRRVLHLAARVGGVLANARRNAEFFADNVLMNTNVLTIGDQYGVERLVAVLSSCAFPPCLDRPATEDDLHVGLPFEGNLGYGYAKRMLDLHIQLLARQKGCRWTTITPVTMYGPHDHFDPVNGHVVAALIHRCWLAKRDGQAFVVWGTGQAIRQFVFAEDVARLLVETLHSGSGPETLIVAPDDGVCVRRLAELIAEVMGFDGPILFDGHGPEGVPIRRLRSIRFAERHPNYVFTGLEAGLRKTVAWFLQTRTAQRSVEPTAVG